MARFMYSVLYIYYEQLCYCSAFLMCLQWRLTEMPKYAAKRSYSWLRSTNSIQHSFRSVSTLTLPFIYLRFYLTFCVT